jgi:hypothetical protein
MKSLNPISCVTVTKYHFEALHWVTFHKCPPIPPLFTTIILLWKACYIITVN